MDWRAYLERAVAAMGAPVPLDDPQLRAEVEAVAARVERVMAGAGLPGDD